MTAAVTFTLRTVASALHDPSSLAAVLDDHLPLLREIGAGDTGPLVVFVLTGGSEGQILDLARTAGARDEPLLLLAHPQHNSLPAAMEALAKVQQDGGRGSISVLGGPSDRAGAAELARRVEEAACARALRGARIGLFGEPSDWLVASSPPAEVVARRWGPTVVPVGLDRVIDQVREVPVTLVRPLVESVTDGAQSLREPRETDVQTAAALHPVLREEALGRNLDAITVRCFDVLGPLHTSGCVALAELNDEGIVAGCEGDLTATIAMLWAKQLLGVRASWIANPAVVDRTAGTVLLAHCTIARSLVKGYRLRSHFESGFGVGIAGELAATEVTLVRIGGADLEQLWIREGRASVPPLREHLCRTQVLVDVDDGDVGDLLEHPLGNHVVLLPGRHADRLRSYWETMVAPGRAPEATDVGVTEGT